MAEHGIGFTTGITGSFRRHKPGRVEMPPGLAEEKVDADEPTFGETMLHLHSAEQTQMVRGRQRRNTVQETSAKASESNEPASVSRSPSRRSRSPGAGAGFTLPVSVSTIRQQKSVEQNERERGVGHIAAIRARQAKHAADQANGKHMHISQESDEFIPHRSPRTCEATNGKQRHRPQERDAANPRQRRKSHENDGPAMRDARVHFDGHPGQNSPQTSPDHSFTHAHGGKGLAGRHAEDSSPNSSRDNSFGRRQPGAADSPLAAGGSGPDSPRSWPRDVGPARRSTWNTLFEAGREVAAPSSSVPARRPPGGFSGRREAFLTSLSARLPGRGEKSPSPTALPPVKGASSSVGASPRSPLDSPSLSPGSPSPTSACLSPSTLSPRAPMGSPSLLSRIVSMHNGRVSEMSRLVEGAKAAEASEEPEGSSPPTTWRGGLRDAAAAADATPASPNFNRRSSSNRGAASLHSQLDQMETILRLSSAASLRSRRRPGEMSDLVVAQQMPQARIHCLQRFACWEVLARGHVSACRWMPPPTMLAHMRYAVCRGGWHWCDEAEAGTLESNCGRDEVGLCAAFSPGPRSTRACVFWAWVRQRECVLLAIAASSSFAASSGPVVGLGRLLSTVIKKVNSIRPVYRLYIDHLVI